SKKELFYAVWEKHGLSASDNNLAQTIFQLRKFLRHFTLSDSIGTIPRVGFFLRNIQLEPLHNSLEGKDRYFNGTASVKKKILPKEKKENGLITASFNTASFGLFCFFLILGYF